MSNGVLCFANNNEINYIKQAEQLAIRIKKYMGLPTSLCTSDQYSTSGKIFDKIIKLKEGQPNNKRYYDTIDFKTLNFKNYSRCKSYDLSPYDKTLVLDVDYIITNNKLSDAFINGDFKIYRHGVDLCPWRKYKEFDFINDKGVPFYWATCFYFVKNQEHKIFFDLLKHISENWNHYKMVYDIDARNFRNDHLFSIGIHMMNGFEDNDWAKPMPGKMYYTLDRDELIEIDKEKLKFLLEKEHTRNEYILGSIRDANVHVMNKFSLERLL